MNLDITKKLTEEIALMSDAEFEENCKYIEILLSKRKQALRIHEINSSVPQLAGYLFNDRFYKNLDELSGFTMSEDNKPIKVFFANDR